MHVQKAHELQVDCFDADVRVRIPKALQPQFCGSAELKRLTGPAKKARHSSFNRIMKEKVQINKKPEGNPA